MELGQKIKKARLDQGLSQRQLCGDTITRNMLSLIENGAANPSMDTLRELAGKLGKPVSYFLEEQAPVSVNGEPMEQARSAFENRDYSQVLAALADYRRPDPVFDREEALLLTLSLIALAEEAIAKGKRPYAQELLERAVREGERTPYYTPELERRRLLVLAQLTSVELPADDRELLLRARQALKERDYHRAAACLDAAQSREGPYWNFLRGQVYLAERRLSEAKQCLEASWDHDPKTCAALLEECCRLLEDFKGAYHYACLLRDWNKN